MKARVRRIRALVLLASLVLGNAGMLAWAAPAQAAPGCHPMPTSERLASDAPCQWASPTSCCHAPAAAQSGPALDFAPPVSAFVPIPPLPAHPVLAFALPCERVPLPARSPILRL